MTKVFTRVRMAAAITMTGMLALAYPPAEAVYTRVFGDRATARVTECLEKKTNPTRFGGGTSTSCSGTWMTSAGERGSGHIGNVSRGDIGRTVEIWLGPRGAQAGNPLSEPAVVVGGGIWVFLLITVHAIGVWALGTGQRAARRLAAGAP
ncbi:hypothetical protein ACFQ07_02215, partial [Actinomadura adrarensis]